MAEALGGAVAGKEVVLQTWHMRLLLPTPSTLAFEKTVKLYGTLVIRGRTFIMVTPYDKSKAEEIAAMLKAAGIRFSISRQRKRIYIYEQKSVEIIRKIMPHLFSSSYIPAPFFFHKSDLRILAQSAYSDSFCYYTHISFAFPLPFTFLLSKRRRRRCPTKSVCPTWRLPSA